ncbi:GNAT family N-acetyltransferase [uncultured Acetobacteroides sp.]|uniref:GNAT family N-acetyltransferase n=1 Tax=uncultured Acetobacteroides sp. TaxID=1760811 RepID=UPI0029F46EBD|nr:GNAT family N-acetyltransferase [uncultured Acetobacteroides sp.]
MNIRPAAPNEAEQLTAIAVESEAYWGGSTSFLVRFEELYKVTASFIEHNPTFVLEEGGEIAGFYAIVKGNDASELEYLYVKASCIGKGYGRMLWEHLMEQCKELGIQQLELVTSPEAKDFYARMGATQVSTVESTIEEGRMIPRMVYMAKGPISRNEIKGKTSYTK